MFFVFVPTNEGSPLRVPWIDADGNEAIATRQNLAGMGLADAVLDSTKEDPLKPPLQPGLQGELNVERIRLSELCDTMTGKGSHAAWKWDRMVRLRIGGRHQSQRSNTSAPKPRISFQEEVAIEWSKQNGPRKAKTLDEAKDVDDASLNIDVA
jgi:hypothetical protein